MPSYLTESEVEALQSSGLHRDTYYAVRHVTDTIFSVARFYGAATIQGEPFTYFPDTDELIRDDVLKFVTQLRKRKRKRTADQAGRKERA